MRLLSRVHTASLSLLIPLLLVPPSASAQLIDPPLEAFEEWVLGPEPIAVIGKDPQTEEEVIGRFGHFLQLPNGSIVVADGTDMSVRIYSPTGEFIGRVARSGEGPGEFSYLSAMGVTPDGGFWGYDLQLQRLSVFDSDGEFLESQLVPSRTTYPGDSSLEPVGMTAHGDFIQTQSSLDSYAEDFPDLAVVRDSLRIWATSVGEPGARMISTLPGSEHFTTRTECGVGRSSGGDRLTAKLIVQNGQLLYSTNDGLRIRILDESGELHDWIDAEVVIHAIPENALERRRRPRPDREQVDDLVCERTISQIPPERYPAYRLIFASPTGSVWFLVRTGVDSQSRQWFSFDRNGRPLARVMVPEDSPIQLVRQITDESAMILQRNDFGEEWLEVWPLVPARTAR